MFIKREPWFRKVKRRSPKVLREKEKEPRQLLVRRLCADSTFILSNT